MWKLPKGNGNSLVSLTQWKYRDQPAANSLPARRHPARWHTAAAHTPGAMASQGNIMKSYENMTIAFVAQASFSCFLVGRSCQLVILWTTTSQSPDERGVEIPAHAAVQCLFLCGDTSESPCPVTKAPQALFIAWGGDPSPRTSQFLDKTKPSGGGHDSLTDAG